MKRIAFMTIVLAVLIASSISIRQIDLLSYDRMANNGSVVHATIVRIPLGKGMYIDAMPLVGRDTQASVRMAAEASSALSGKRPGTIFVKLKAGSPVVTGPSAGLPFSLAFYSMETGRNLPDFTGTGVVLPDGSIGAVGKIDEKIEVAYQAGHKKVLVPAIGFNKSLAKKWKGKIEVVPVYTLEQALESLGENVSVEKCDTAQFMDVMCAVASKMILRAEEMGANTTNATLQLEEGNCYTASSLAFGLWVSRRKEMFSNLSEEDFHIISKQLEQKAKEIRNRSRLKLKGSHDMEIYVITLERIDDALSSINETDPDAMAYAYERMETAKVWESMLGRLGGNSVNSNELKGVSLERYEQAREYYAYASTMLPPQYLEKASELLSKARKEIVKKDYGLSIAHSLQSMAFSDYAISLALSGNITSLANGKREIVSELPDCSFISWSYGQLGDYYLSRDPAIATLYYEYAIGYSSLARDFLTNKSIFSKLLHVRSN